MDGPGSPSRTLGTASGPLVGVDLKTGRRHPAGRCATVLEARYAAGYLVYVQPDGTLMAAPFDSGGSG